jgi:hypothetical protein
VGANPPLAKMPLAASTSLPHDSFHYLSVIELRRMSLAPLMVLSSHACILGSGHRAPMRVFHGEYTELTSPMRVCLICSSHAAHTTCALVLPCPPRICPPYPTHPTFLTCWPHCVTEPRRYASMSLGTSPASLLCKHDRPTGSLPAPHTSHMSSTSTCHALAAMGTT